MLWKGKKEILNVSKMRRRISELECVYVNSYERFFPFPPLLDTIKKWLCLFNLKKKSLSIFLFLPHDFPLSSSLINLNLDRQLASTFRHLFPFLIFRA